MDMEEIFREDDIALEAYKISQNSSKVHALVVGLMGGTVHGIGAFNKYMEGLEVCLCVYWLVMCVGQTMPLVESGLAVALCMTKDRVPE